MKQSNIRQTKKKESLFSVINGLVIKSLSSKLVFRFSFFYIITITFYIKYCIGNDDITYLRRKAINFIS